MPCDLAALGIDVSTRKLAFAALDEHGNVRHSVFNLASATGARRLVSVREVTRAALGSYRDACVIAVEWPAVGAATNEHLMAAAAVVLEAAQSARPDAVVLDVRIGTWKRDSVGFGNATKGHVMMHARALGYDGVDQDVADATCIAQYALEAWMRQVEGVAV